MTYLVVHINASYNLLECAYDAIIIQGETRMNENGAFNEFINGYKGYEAIYIADKDYEIL